MSNKKILTIFSIFIISFIGIVIICSVLFLGNGNHGFNWVNYDLHNGHNFQPQWKTFPTIPNWKGV